MGLLGPASVQSAAISRSEDFRDSGPPRCAARIQSLGLLGRGMLVCHSHLSHASMPAAGQDLLCTCVTGGIGDSGQVRQVTAASSSQNT